MYYKSMCSLNIVLGRFARVRRRAQLIQQTAEGLVTELVTHIHHVESLADDVTAAACSCSVRLVADLRGG